jgi:Inner membrane component of T3SS, cytoplasmic domain
VSFRWFVYYCAMMGGCAAYVGWVLGRLTRVEHHVALAGLKGLFLGALLGLGIGMVDVLGSSGGRRLLPSLLRLGLAFAVGGLGGFVGGALGQILFAWLQWPALLIVGWTITGLLIGAAPGMFDVLAGLLRNDELRGAWRKMFNGLLGGTLGGIVGGGLFLLLQAASVKLFGDKAEGFWSPSATGFVVLGLFIGLMIGLAQVILKEAWLRVEEGFRPRRELILTRAETTVGRAETCDLGLFGDPEVERLHARISRRGSRYLLSDEDTPGGTYLNGERIDGATPLRSGDVIGVGRCLLRFGERHKRSEEET